MKIAVIGGGSTYTPELVEGFARRADVLAVDELVLHDVDAERLRRSSAVWPQRILRPARVRRAAASTTSDRTAAIDGAAAVLVQLRSAARTPGWSTRRCPTSAA